MLEGRELAGWSRQTGASSPATPPVSGLDPLPFVGSGSPRVILKSVKSQHGLAGQAMARRRDGEFSGSFQ